MTQKERIISVARHLLSAIAGYAFIKSLFSLGNAQIVGLVLFAAAIFLSARAKVLMTDIVNGILRHVVSFIGGMVIALTAFDITSKQTIVGLILVVAAILMSQFSPRNASSTFITAANGDTYRLNSKAPPISNSGIL